jgi:hypothetical protein
MFWSSTENVNDTTAAINYSFQTGSDIVTVGPLIKSRFQASVRCVAN